MRTNDWTDGTHVGYTPSGYAWRSIDQTEYEHYRAHVIRASARWRKQQAARYERIERIERGAAAGGAR